MSFGDLIGELVTSEAAVLATSGERARGVTLERHWSEARGGHLLRARLRNDGGAAVRVKEIVVCAARHNLPAEIAYYGEGFQMLSQTAGTLGAPRSVGNYTDAGHYKIPQAPERLTAYGLATLTAPPSRPWRAAQSTRRAWSPA